MRKPTTTLVCALAVLAFAATVSAEIYTGSGEEIDEIAAKLAEEEESDALYDSQFCGEEAGIDSCFECRPIAYAVAFEHNGTWTLISDLVWDSEGLVYTVCWNPTAMTDVDGVRMYWKTTSSICCSYCDGSYTEAQYYNGSSPPSFENTTGTDSCWSLIPSGVAYRGEELNYYNNFDFHPTSRYVVGRMNSWFESRIYIADCPE